MTIKAPFLDETSHLSLEIAKVTTCSSTHFTLFLELIDDLSDIAGHQELNQATEEHEWHSKQKHAPLSTNEAPKESFSIFLNLLVSLLFGA